METTSKAGGAPALALYLTEPVRAAGEYATFRAARWATALPRGDDHPVLVLPGLLSADRSTRPLRHALRALGYHAHGWRLGRNIGPTAQAVTGMRARLDELAERHGRPVTVIGWSLGGIFARALGRRMPDAVRQVITLGSPIRMEHTSQARAYAAFERYSHLHAERWDLPLERGSAPLQVPSTSIYSRTDGIVAWQACLDLPAPNAENIPVFGSHVGLGCNLAALWAVADRLAQPEGTWQPFRPTPLWRRFLRATTAPLPGPVFVGGTA